MTALLDLTDLRSRALADYSDKPAWLEARATRATATEVAKLAAGGPGTRAALADEKRSGVFRELNTPHVNRGHDREAIIAEWACRRAAGKYQAELTANGTLFHSQGNDRHAATPDLIGRMGERIVIGEIKTSKYDLDPGSESSHFGRTTYWDQIQWQLYVTGADDCLFVWEQHDDQWPDPQPINLEPSWTWIGRDEKRIARLIEIADDFLLELDMPEPAPTDEEIEQAGRRVLLGRANETAGKRLKDDAWKTLQRLTAGRPSFSQATNLAQVSWKSETVVKETTDVDAAKETAPGLWEALEKARTEWEAHLKEHVVEEEVLVERLTVTAPKGGLV